MKDGANFKKVEDNNKKVKSWKPPNKSEFNVDRNAGQAGLKNAGNVIFKQHSFDNNADSQLVSGDGVGEMKSSKLRYGYSRTWFGCQSTQSKDYFPCSLEGDHIKQSGPKSTGSQKRILLEKKTDVAPSPAPITLLKKNNSRNVKDVILSATTKKMAESENEKQGTVTSQKSSAIDDLMEQFSKQRLNTSGPVEVGELPAACSSSKSVVNVNYSSNLDVRMLLNVHFFCSYIVI